MCQLNPLANSSITSANLPVVHLKPWSCPRKQQHVEGGNRPRQLQPIRRTSGLTTWLWRWHLMLPWLLHQLILLSTALPLNLCPNSHIEGGCSIWIPSRHTFLVTTEPQFDFLELPILTPPKWLAIFYLFLSEQYWTVVRENWNTIDLNSCMDEWTSKKPSSRWPSMNTVRHGFYMHGGWLLWTLWKTSMRVQLTGTMFHLIQVTNCPILTPPCTITSRTLIDITCTCLHLPSIYQMTSQWKWVQTINDPIVLTFL